MEGGGVQDNVDWIHRNHNMLLWQADMKTVTNHQVPHNEENFFERFKTCRPLEQVFASRIPFISSFLLTPGLKNARTYLVVTLHTYSQRSNRSLRI